MTFDFSYLVAGQPVPWNRLAADVWRLAQACPPELREIIRNSETADVRRKYSFYSILVLKIGRTVYIHPHLTGMDITSQHRAISKVCEKFDALKIGKMLTESLVEELYSGELDWAFAKALELRRRRAALFKIEHTAEQEASIAEFEQRRLAYTSRELEAILKAVSKVSCK